MILNYGGRVFAFFFCKQKLSKLSKLSLSKQCALVIIFQKKLQCALILIGACAVNGLNTVHLKIILCIQQNIYIPIKLFINFCILYEYCHFTRFRLLIIQFTLAHCVIFFNLLTNDNATIQSLLTHSFPCTRHHAPLQFQLTAPISTGLCYISSHQFYIGVYRSHRVDRSVLRHFLSSQFYLNHLMEFNEILQGACIPRGDVHIQKTSRLNVSLQSNGLFPYFLQSYEPPNGI